MNYNGKHYSSIRKLALPVFVFLMVIGAGFVSLPAFAGSASETTKSDVYTAAQANLGKSLYEKECASCHGAKLEGMGQNPALAGSDFLDRWQGQTLDDLYQIIQGTMPATKPGSLTPDQSVQVIAYILQANKMPDGKTDLPKDEAALKAVKVEKP